MSKKLPLVLADDSSEQQIQRNDWLDPQKTKLVDQAQFDALVNQFRHLLLCLHESGITLPDDLVNEIESMEKPICSLNFP